MLHRLGRSHSANKIKPEYFDLMKDCLMAALAHRLAGKWTPEGLASQGCVGGLCLELARVVWRTVP